MPVTPGSVWMHLIERLVTELAAGKPTAMVIVIEDPDSPLKSYARSLIIRKDLDPYEIDSAKVDEATALLRKVVTEGR